MTHFSVREINSTSYIFLSQTVGPALLSLSTFSPIGTGLSLKLKMSVSTPPLYSYCFSSPPIIPSLGLHTMSVCRTPGHRFLAKVDRIDCFRQQSGAATKRDLSTCLSSPAQPTTTSWKLQARQIPSNQRCNLVALIMLDNRMDFPC